MITALLMNAAIFAASLFLSGRFFASRGPHYRALSAAIFFYAQIILILLLWGVPEKLYLGNIALSAFAALLISCFLCYRSIAVNSGHYRLPGEFFSNKVAILCLSFLLGFGIVKIAINLVNPPFGWDSLNYHFSFPAEWLKQANLRNPITINDDLGPTYYPINGSLIYFWLLAPLKNVFLADIGQIPFFAISFLAVYGICRQLNTGREYSLYAAAIFTITPNYFKQAEIAYVDVMVCAWFLTAVYFFLSFCRTGEIKDVFLFSSGVGLLIGTKTTALPYGGVLFVVFLIIVLARYKSLGCRKTALFIIVSCLLIVIFGGYGYIRNYLETGNPLYPLNISFLGKEIFKGVYDKANYSVRVVSGDYSLSKILFHEGAGAGALVFLLPGLFFLVIDAARTKAVKLDRFLVLLLFIILFLIWRYVIPLANLRYLYPAFALGYIAAFSAFSTNKPYNIIVRVIAVLCFFASCAEIASHLELLFSFLFSFLLFFSLGKIYAVISKLKTVHWILISILAFIPLYLLNIDYNKNEYKRYEKMVKYSGLWPEAAQAWRWLNENTAKDNIAYAGRPVPFPLYGTNFKNNVFYASVNSVDPAMAHYFPDSFYRWGADFLELHKSLEREGNYRQHPDYAAWLLNLKRRKTGYVFIYSLHQTKEIIFPIEDAWAAQHPENFSLTFSNPTVHIYKII